MGTNEDERVAVARLEAYQRAMERVRPFMEGTDLTLGEVLALLPEGEARNIALVLSATGVHEDD